MDAVHRGDTAGKKLGKSIILPSTHTGGPRYRIQNYQDAMTLCKWAGYPDLFLTFTCNPKWPEITEALDMVQQHDDPNRVDIVCKVFEIKLKQLMQDLKTTKIFGSITAKIPDASIEPDGFNAVNKFMIHGPCGDLYPSSPCMVYPSVERLPFNLPGEHTITFKENTNLEAVIARPGVEKTKFTEWFEINKKYEDAKKLSYSAFPTEWVLISKEKVWTKRQKGKTIGRRYFTHPSVGERFYMSMLLNFVNGCTSFEDIRTIDGFTHPTYKGACYARGLLDDDSEWVDCLEEASSWATGYELRHLFVTILTHCQVSNPLRLWNTHYEALSEDIAILQRKRFKVNNLKLTASKIEAYTLFEIESIMMKMGNSLKEVDGMPLPNQQLLRELRNRLVNEERDYNCEDLRVFHDTNFPLLNQCQNKAYDAIMDSVYEDRGDLIFIHGRGGTWKTFLWKTIIARLRSEGKIVLPVASSGIATLLLPNGWTAHSIFRIPLNVTAESTCEIRHGT